MIKIEVDESKMANIFFKLQLNLIQFYIFIFQVMVGDNIRCDSIRTSPTAHESSAELSVIGRDTKSALNSSHGILLLAALSWHLHLL